MAKPGEVVANTCGCVCDGSVNSRIQNDVQIETVGIGEHTRNGSSEMIAEADESTGR